MVGSVYSGEQVSPALLETHPATAKRGPVTVLFADLCGYTSLSETLDPEDLRDVMTQVFGGITRIATKYEAHVDKLLGDGALILFGVPHPHEDDAFRAIMAAREIREFLVEQSPRLESITGRELHVHSAISTGVIVTSPGDDATASSALGDSVNLASRLLSLAGPDEIVCAEQTQAQAQGYFDFESLGSQTVRGREGTVNV
jgi:adenylate cyclase